MTYSQRIAKALLMGQEISYRSMETSIQCNHPYKPLKQAIEFVEGLGKKVRERQNINSSNNKVYLTWQVV